MKCKSSQVRSVDSAKKNKSNTTEEHVYINISKKREIKSKMCNRIKKYKTNKMCKKQYTGTYSNMNRDVQEGCVNGLYRVYTCSSNTDDGKCKCYETGFVFRSLMAWGKKLLLSLSVFAIMLLKAVNHLAMRINLYQYGNQFSLCYALKKTKCYHHYFIVSPQKGMIICVLGVFWINAMTFFPSTHQ